MMNEKGRELSTHHSSLSINTPAIRFKGFSKGWNEKKLYEVCQEFQSGKFIKAEAIKVGEAYPVYGGNGLRGYTDSYNYDGTYALIGRQGALCGNMSISTGKAYFTEHAIAVRANNCGDTTYLFYLLGIMKLGQYSGQSAQPGLAVNKLIELIDYFPESVEQTKIGNYFQQLDTLIALHQQKHDKLLNLKKALLEKMFPKQGATVPEIRFKGFSGEWEKKALEGCADLLTGNPFDSKKFSKEGIFLVRGMNVKRGYLDISADISEYWPTSCELEKFLLKENDILIQMDGALIGKSYAKVKSKNLPALLVQRVTRIRSNEIDSDFTYQYIQRDFLKHISKIKTETAVPHLSLNDIRNFQVSIPKPKEQTKIGNLFKQLDTLLNQHQAQLKKLNNIKQACLEKMFA